MLSDSRCRVAGHRAGNSIAGIVGIAANNPKVRLTYHQERLRIYCALVNRNRPPDLLTEDDVRNGRLKEYSVAYWVGDCCPLDVFAALSNWVAGGGRLVATAGAFHFDENRNPITAGRALPGLQSSELNEATRFIRPLVELVRLKPLVSVLGMPALAIEDRIAVAPRTLIAAWFSDESPAIVRRNHGKGRRTYIAILPDLTYLWAAYHCQFPRAAPVATCCRLLSTKPPSVSFSMKRLPSRRKLIPTARASMRNFSLRRTTRDSDCQLRSGCKPRRDADD